MPAEVTTTLVLISVYGIIAIATQLGMMAGAFSLATIGWAAVGAYVTALATVTWGTSTTVGLLVAVLLAVVLGPVVMLPVRRISGLYFALVSLAFVLVLQSVFSSTDYFGGSLGIFGIPLETTLPKALVWLGMIAALAAYVSTGRRGIVIRAAGQDPAVARSLGVSVNVVHVLIGALSSAMAAVAGYLYVGYVGYIDPAQFGFALVVQILVMVVIGGRSSWIGALLGAALIVSLPVVLSPIAEWRDEVNGLLLIAIVILQPNGLLGMISTGYRKIRLRFPNPASGVEEEIEPLALTGGTGR